ncbi:MAG TPA: xylulokinase, partial [Candidatus Omnitrophica bacterium]|nr:xylulokinase [Candidatus Omnitrophota bacterium]
MGEFLLGIDLGTTNAKAILIDRRGKIIFLTSCSYPILAPRPNFSEQDPQVWWRASKDMLNKISSMVNLKDIKAIGLSGQMHGLVMVDKRGLPLKNAIIWTDSRSTPQVKEMEDKVGEGRLYTITGFPPFPGFLGPSLLWIKENQSHILKKINCVLLPKDYLKFKFTENFSTDFSDASGTLLFDIEKRQWSEEIIEKLDLPFEIFPQVLESSQIAGTISHKAHEETGLSKDTIVLCGGGDQAISAISNGVIKEGTVSSTIGTGGQ